MFNAILTFKKYKPAFVCLSILILFAPSQAAAVAKESARNFDSLQKRLINDGFDANQIKRLYSKPQIHFDTRGVSLFFMHQESKLNYDQFLSRRSIQKARNYMKDHKAFLADAEREFGVDPTIIIAIILVETRLGTYLGSRSILNTLSTMASLADTDVRNIFWNEIRDSSPLTRKKFKEKANKKSEWAYSELKAFLKYTTRERLDPVAMNGSYAGAMGIAQFMPSNVLALAKDGNNDGQINLLHHADAIASIAGFLKHYGWYPGIDPNEAYKVLLNYNYSKPYANTLLKISRRLKGR
jgi:membrane-bound lytic murein transglycosylase B